ncbi:hypothetical protein HaLaN_00414 [Haematococcus lacustris]|uniref:Uncharacterized protein n=1 Tax=Haematococcus lacustris TaxID=44745 RepID=A0A699YIY6_HAELA|nr:hypothetical protein HaLaN_00414 [Haematococcus lacustris]
MVEMLLAQSFAKNMGL